MPLGDPWYIAVVTKGSKELQVCNLLLEFIFVAEGLSLIVVTKSN